MDYSNWDRFDDMSNLRKNLMDKYQKGIINSGEMYMLNQIEDGVNEILKQRIKERLK